MKIKSAEQVLIEDQIIKLLDHNVPLTKIDIILVMRKYAEQFIDLAAQNADILVNNWDHQDVEVDRESILKIKELIK